MSDQYQQHQQHQQRGSSIHVLSVENDQTARQALTEYLSLFPDFVVAGEAPDASEAWRKLQQHSIDVVLLDLALPSGKGEKLIRRIRKTYPAIRVLVLTAADRPDDIFSAMDAGADGYVLKGNLSKALETAIRSVRLGTVWLDPDIARQVLEIIQNSPVEKESRELPTGYLRIPLLPEEASTLAEVAGSSCQDGVCMVDASFLKKLRRFAPAAEPG